MISMDTLLPWRHDQITTCMLYIVGARYHSVSDSAHLISYDGASKQWDHVAEFIPGGTSANGGFDGGDVKSSCRDWVAISAPFERYREYGQSIVVLVA